MITIASALVSDGCDVIASLPKAITTPILHTQYSILFRHVYTFAQAAGRFALFHLLSLSRRDLLFLLAGKRVGGGAIEGFMGEAWDHVRDEGEQHRHIMHEGEDEDGQ